jgi:hypothetical protein
MPSLRRSPQLTLAWWLFVLALALQMMLSAPALLLLGIPYDAPFGPAVAKFHPGAYLLVLAWLAALACHGNPLRIGARQIARYPALAGYFVAMVLVFVWVIYRHGSSGAAFIVQTLWMPAIAAFTLALHDEERHRELLVILMLLLGLNALVALGESLLARRLIPLYINRDDAMAGGSFRASAFLGHPLVNAMVTAALLPACALLPWARKWRVALAGVLLLALFAFGGRTSLALSVLVYGTAALVFVSLGVARGRYSYLQLTGGVLALMLGAVALVLVVASTGMGTRIFQNLSQDNSANARLLAWTAFEHVRAADLWVGLAPAQIDTVALRMGLDPRFEAIENYWIYLLLMLGVVGFVPFVAGLGSLFVLLWRSAALPMRAALFVYLVGSSTGNTLASKDVSLMLLTVAVLAGAAFRSHKRPAQVVAASTRLRPHAPSPWPEAAA